MTQKEVRELENGAQLQLRNPAVQVSREIIRCRACGGSLDRLGWACAG